MSGMCIQVLIKLGFGKNYPSDIMGRIKCSYGWDGCKGRGWGGGGDRGCWNTWCKCCSGLGSLTCTE